MLEQFSRTQLLLGEKSMEKLYASHVAVFGIGGVGGFAVEALARSGIGEFSLFDDDKVCLSNINRQIIATHDTIGLAKVDVMKDRILSINPKSAVHANECFFNEENADEIDYTKFDYIIDAIDTVSSKILLIKKADEFNIPIISSMGAGAKLDPTAFTVTDIYKTSVCPLAKVMRKELNKAGIKKLKVVFSKEQPFKPITEAEPETKDLPKHAKRQTIPSISFVPSVAGLIIGGEVIKDIAKNI